MAYIKPKVKIAHSTKAVMKMEEADKDSGVEEEEFKARTPGTAKAKASQEEEQKARKGINTELCITCTSGGNWTYKVYDKLMQFEQSKRTTDMTVRYHRQHQELKEDLEDRYCVPWDAPASRPSRCADERKDYVEIFMAVVVNAKAPTTAPSPYTSRPSHCANEHKYYAKNFIATLANLKTQTAAHWPQKARAKSPAKSTSLSQEYLTNALQH